MWFGEICMICCVVAACFILRYFVKWGEVCRWFGFDDIYGDRDEYGFRSYCELDEYAD